MENKPSFEKRESKRIYKDYIISYMHDSFPNVKYDISQIKNISEGGILFTTDKPFQKGDILKIKIRLPEFGDYVIFKVQVIDSKEVAKDLLYHTRAMFVEIDKNVKEVIRRMTN